MTSTKIPDLNRRTFVKTLATLGTGLAASAALPGCANQSPSAQNDKPLHEPSTPISTITASDAATVVDTPAGKLRGCRHNGIYIFKGIPYADSTSGPNRFMPPQPPKPWTGIRNALQYGRVCPNRDSAHFSTDSKNSAASDEDQFVLHRGCADKISGEDCLRLNIWTSEINGRRKRPVMVFMHGGAFSGGSGQDLLAYDGESLARDQDVVLINLNHRLNVYGFLNLSEIGGDRFAPSANVGMLDLIAVLQWVRDNISNFGGDPDNVTIFGQSGGGGKVITLMAMPAAKGLFHRAIVQSGPYLRMLSPDYSLQVAAAVMQQLGLSKNDIAALQKIPVDKLSGAAADAIKKIPARKAGTLRQTFGDSGWGPTVDGALLPNHPFDPAAPAVSAHVPLLTGSNLQEFISGLDHPERLAMPMTEVTQRVAAEFGPKAPAIINAYRREYPRMTPFQLYAAMAASSLRQAAFDQAERKAALHAAPAYAYLYAWRTPVLDDRPGSFHAAELAFAFGNGARCDHYSAGSKEGLALSSQMSTAWATFARTGNPNHPGLPHWHAYQPHTRPTLILDTPCTLKYAPESEPLRLIAEA